MVCSHYCIVLLLHRTSNSCCLGSVFLVNVYSLSLAVAARCTRTDFLFHLNCFKIDSHSDITGDRTQAACRTCWNTYSMATAPAVTRHLRHANRGYASSGALVLAMDPTRDPERDNLRNGSCLTRSVPGFAQGTRHHQPLPVYLNI